MLPETQQQRIREEAERLYPYPKKDYEITYRESEIMEKKQDVYEATATLYQEKLNEEIEDKENFAIAFAIWAMHDPQAKAYQEAGITAYGLLEKYKDRPFINDAILQ